LLQRLDAAQRAVRTPPPASGVGARPAPVPVAAVAAPGGAAAKLPALRHFADAAGHYLIPASGRLVQRFGKTVAGITSQGLAYVTRPGAQVVAPYDGRVIFAGPFHGYGHILIVEHADGYDSLIAGLARINASVGQWVVSGEPVGTMPEGEDKPRLYLELRHDGQPLNPSPWLATTSQEKVPH
jgi:septal ring factor EnvC (AmiA/AmiB activator)